MVLLDYSTTLSDGSVVIVEHRNNGSFISVDGVEWDLMCSAPEAVISALSETAQDELLDYIETSRYDYLVVNCI